MRRFFLALPIALAFFASAAIPAYAANLPLLDPNFSIVPTECTACPCGVAGLLQFIQNLMNAGVSLGVIVITLIIAYAGFVLVMSPTNPEAKSQARNMIMNAFVGFIIVLSAWMIVDFVMKILYDGGGQFGPWNKILQISDTSSCIQPQAITQITGLPGIVQGVVNGVTGATGGGGGTTPTPIGGAGVLCASGNTACSSSAIKAMGSSLGQSITDGQANALSCIAVTESSGNPNSPDSPSGACGTFQILSAHGNSTWNQPSMHQAPCSDNSSCNDSSCNLQTALIMFGKSSYTPWTCPGCNAKASACVAKYDPTHT